MIWVDRIAGNAGHATCDEMICRRFPDYMLPHRNARELFVDRLCGGSGSAHRLDHCVPEKIATPGDIKNAIAAMEAAMSPGKAPRKIVNWHQADFPDTSAISLSPEICHLSNHVNFPKPNETGTNEIRPIRN